MKLLARVLGGLVLSAIVLFCVFGFLATYEYSEAARRRPWQIGYGLGALLGLAGMFRLFRTRH